jgi:hypothetical protein
VGSGSPPVKLSPVSSHFYPDQLHVLNITSNGRKYSTSILSKPSRFPTKPTAQIDAVHCQALHQLLCRPPPPRLHLGFRPNHHRWFITRWWWWSGRNPKWWWWFINRPSATTLSLGQFFCTHQTKPLFPQKYNQNQTPPPTSSQLSTSYTFIRSTTPLSTKSWVRFWKTLVFVNAMAVSMSFAGAKLEALFLKSSSSRASPSSQLPSIFGKPIRSRKSLKRARVYHKVVVVVWAIIRGFVGFLILFPLLLLL